jgi:pantoate--beta-alanine ligase
MGALHAGHLSLVARSRDECDVTAVTIFVNPTQFGPHEDFSRYPRTLDEDLQQLSTANTDLVFVPEHEQLYPNGYSTYVDPPLLAQPLEGVFRPGHFRGVATIVLKLFQILPASIAYFGQKDFQQLAVIRRMVEDLNVPIRIQACDTMREPDGLAMSSRNRYLSPQQRSSALGLSKALMLAKEMVEQQITLTSLIEPAMHELLYQAGIERIEYARIVDRETLQPLEAVDRPAIALIAAYVGKTRLIDNLLL